MNSPGTPILSLGMSLFLALGFAFPLSAQQPEVPGDKPADAPPAPAKQEADPVPQLLENLTSQNVNVASSAARSLGVIFTPSKDRPENQVKPVIEALVERLDAPQGAPLRREVATALGRIRSRIPLEALKASMDDEDVEVAIASSRAVANILPRDSARSFLIERGSDESETVKAAVYEAFAPLAKPEDKDFLVAGLSIDNWRIQMNAVRGLERAVRTGAQIEPETYDQVAAVLNQSMVPASEAAMHFLSNLRNEQSLRATIAVLDNFQEPDSWRGRVWALRTLRRMGFPTLRPAVPAVIRQLGDRTANVQNESRGLLAWLRKEHYVSQDGLFPLLVAELETAPTPELKSGIMSEMRGQVPQEFASRIAKVASGALEESLESKELWPLRAHAITMLGATGYTGQVETIAGCVGDDVPNVRQAAGKALEQLAPLCTEEQKGVVGPQLTELMTQPLDWRKTAIAARAAGFFPHADAIPSLIRLLSHSVLNVRDAAADSLVRTLQADPALKATIAEQVPLELERNEAAWEVGAKVLGGLQDADSLPLIVRILKQGNWRAQTNAAQAVVQLSAAGQIEDPALSEVLIEVAQSEILQVQEAANQALKAVASQD